jgi:hypothetical protein
MNKKILGILAIGGLVVGICSQVLADPSTTVTPTLGNPGADQVSGVDGVSSGVSSGTSAMVSQTVHLNLPKATALHLAVTDLTFDLSKLGLTEVREDEKRKQICVYGVMDKNFNVKDSVADDQGAVKPLGTQYELIKDKWPNIQIAKDTFDGVVTSYPPIRLDKTGNLIPGSKNHFVCYSTFILQKFSNGTKWNLSVERSDKVPGPGRINDIYIQDNPCHSPGGINLQKIDDVKSTALLDYSKVINGTTGSVVKGYLQKGDYTCGTKSWLDDLVIIAVKVDGETAGDNTAKLQYTLSTTEFPAATTTN